MIRLLGGAEGRPGARRVLVAVIVALVVLDAILVGWALQASRTSPPTSSAPWSPPASAAPTSPQSEASIAPSAEPTAELGGDQAAQPIGSRLLAVGTGALWRAEVGTCEAADGTIEVSRDEGATWQPVALGDPQPAAVLAILTGPPGLQASVVYQDTACVVGAQRTFDGGSGWQQNPDVLAVASYVTSDDEVVLAGATSAAPCTDPVLVRGPTVVLCADGLRVGADGSWSEAIEGVLAVAAFDQSRVVVASIGSGECAGVGIALMTVADAASEPIGCLEASAAEGVAVAASGSTVWAWADDAVVSLSIG